MAIFGKMPLKVEQSSKDKCDVFLICYR